MGWSAEKQRAYAKAWHQANRATANQKRLEHYRENREAHLARCRQWVEENRERNRAYKKQWYEANKERLREKAIARYPQTFARVRERQATDIQFALASRLRARIQKAIRACGATRAARVADLIGCSVEQFRAHIERQFAKGMTWENRSRWHLDHIRPIAGFDLSDAEQQRACFHFTNIRPLWRRENQQKSNQRLLLL